MKLKKIIPGFKSVAIAILTVIVMSGCSTPKDVTYFQDVTQEVITLPSTGEIKIAPNDKLSIIVKTMDSNLSALFNLPIVTDRFVDSMASTATKGNQRTSTAMSSGLSKYTVSPNGTIDFPVLGEIKVAGMTRYELAGFIKGELMGRDLAKDPVVTVDFVNMGVSMMGEITVPGLYDINQDQISLLEAISMAGDLTLNGRRDNVTVLRENEGQIQTYKVDLTNFKELAQSPVYYLQQGDVVYVEPNDMKKRESTTNGNNVYSTSFWISFASLLTSVVTTIGVFVVK